MVVRGLVPVPKPQKTLLQHRVKFLQLSLGGVWGKDDFWLFSAKEVSNQGSPLWQGIWEAWKQVRIGIVKQEPVGIEEVLKQSICFNTDIKNDEGKVWGKTYQSMFKSWSNKGVTWVKDIQDLEKGNLKTALDIRRKTRSLHLEQIRKEILESLPLNGMPIEEGYWLVLDEEGIDQEFFHVTNLADEGIYVHAYILEKSRRLIKSINHPIFLDAELKVTST